MASRFLENLWTSGITPRVLNFAPRWLVSSHSHFSFVRGDAGNRWIRDCELQSHSGSYGEEKLTSIPVIQPVFLTQNHSWRVTVHWFLSDSYKIVFDVEGKRGKFLFGCGRKDGASESLKLWWNIMWLLIYRKWKSFLILRTSHF